jgi:hypothetical protein
MELYELYASYAIKLFKFVGRLTLSLPIKFSYYLLKVSPNVAFRVLHVANFYP